MADRDNKGAEGEGKGVYTVQGKVKVINDECPKESFSIWSLIIGIFTFVAAIVFIPILFLVWFVTLLRVCYIVFFMSDSKKEALARGMFTKLHKQIREATVIANKKKENK